MNIIEDLFKKAMENGDIDENIESLNEYLKTVFSDKIEKMEKMLNEDVFISIKRKNNKVSVKGIGSPVSLAILLESVKEDLLKEADMSKEEFEKLNSIVKTERKEVK